ncbi:SIMPL domain-containing protein [Candidatus Parcubacteria bacterium]|nr:SIMPL domain-containing protein [Candidatus Parcubacteria bacterium]
MNNEFTSSKVVRVISILFLAVATLFLLAKTINAFNGDGTPAEGKPHITVSGQGDYSAKPDIAIISYSVIEEGKTPAIAQEKATKKWNAALEYLKSVGVADKDVKTVGYNLNPKYDYSGANRICSPGYCPPSGTPVLIGYEIYQTAEVKIRDLTKAGDVLVGVGSLGVQNISSLQLTFDNPDMVMAEARKLAIAEAKEKAQILANDLGVRLVRISSFEENGSNPYFSKLEMQAGRATANDAVAPAPMIPTGENKVISNVTITYEIR